jgi:Lrp/AsnC family transcriptional regulator for asnA, asnC and gidA
MAIDDAVDETDRLLLELLTKDARRSNVELAREVNLTEGAVRKRLSRLLRDGFVRFSAGLNLFKLGYQIEVLIGLQTDQRRLPGVIDTLRALPEEESILGTAGRNDVLVGACFRTRSDLQAFLMQTLPNVPGILRTETSYVLSVPKRSSNWIDERCVDDGKRGGVKPALPSVSREQPVFAAGERGGWWRG